MVRISSRQNRYGAAAVEFTVLLAPTDAQIVPPVRRPAAATDRRENGVFQAFAVERRKPSRRWSNLRDVSDQLWRKPRRLAGAVGSNRSIPGGQIVDQPIAPHDIILAPGPAEGGNTAGGHKSAPQVSPAVGLSTGNCRRRERGSRCLNKYACLLTPSWWCIQARGERGAARIGINDYSSLTVVTATSGGNDQSQMLLIVLLRLDSVAGFCLRNCTKNKSIVAFSRWW